MIVVNDGSSDGTSAVAFDFIRRFGFDAVHLLQLPQNCGKVIQIPRHACHFRTQPPPTICLSSNALVMCCT